MTEEKKEEKPMFESGEAFVRGVRNVYRLYVKLLPLWTEDNPCGAPLLTVMDEMMTVITDLRDRVFGIFKKQEIDIYVALHSMLGLLQIASRLIQEEELPKHQAKSLFYGVLSCFRDVEEGVAGITSRKRDDDWLKTYR